jgi:hypothetical protein
MMKLLMLLAPGLIQRIPDFLANWSYPRILKQMLMLTLANFEGVDPKIIGQDLVDAFTNAADLTVLDQDGPTVAFYHIILEGISEWARLFNVDFTLTGEQMAPLMVSLGNKIVNDPDFAG